MAGHGVGAVTALLAAIDGGARLWEQDGLWSSSRIHRYYRWRWPFRAATALLTLLACAVLIPVLVALAGAAAYGLAFLLSLLGAGAGTTLAADVAGWLGWVFAGPQLPTLVPRLVMALLLVLVAVLVGAVWLARPPRAGLARTARGRWWWRLVGAPLDPKPLREACASMVWDLLKGAAAGKRPDVAGMSRRYVDVLTENLDQPAFRELMVAACDIDARHDLVGAVLREPSRPSFVASRPGRERAAEVIDLAGAGRELLFDLLGGALTPPTGVEPAPLTFPGDGFWRGETHRVTDRPGLLGRLLFELAEVGVEQVIVVSASAPALAAHRLSSPAFDPRARLGEALDAAESAACTEALQIAALRFDGVFVIRPAHNVAGPFDFADARDEASDRDRSLRDLQQQGYEEAYHQFVEPVVGASGELLFPVRP